jgi:hypothetical protein
MAPIYTSRPLPSKTVQSPDYIQKGIEGKTTGRLEEIHFTGRPDIVQPHYPQYVANLPAFLTSTATQRKVFCGKTYWPQLDPKHLIPLPLPPLTISPVKPLVRDEEKAAYRSRLPQDTKITVYLKRECYVVSNQTPTSILTLPPTDPNVPSSTDSVSLSGMRQFLTTLKIVTLFLTTHTYPAFQTDLDEAVDTSMDMDIYFSKPVHAIEGYRGMESIYKSRTRSKVWPVGEPNPPLDVPSYDAVDKVFSAHGSVIVAKPAPLYPKVNYGLPSQCPNLPGFVLPYFRGMILPAEASIITIMRRFFLACFGDQPDSSVSRWATWRNSVSKWHKTDSGMAMAHILFCIQTALECQGRLFVFITSTAYIGSAILGFKFKIDVDGVLMSPDSATVVRQLAVDLDDHEKAVSKISDILKDMALLGSTDIEMSVGVDVSTPRKLYKELTIRESPTAEQKEDLMELVGKLGFHQKYWSMSGDTVARAINLILSSDPLPEDLPMYLQSKCVFEERNRIYEVLSVFGPTAPSLVDGQGRDCVIPQGINAPDPASSVPEGQTERLMSKIFISPKNINVAVNDWRGIIRKRKIKQNPTERAGGFRTISLLGPQRDKVWNALKMIPWDDQGKGKGKRTAEDEGDRPEASKKPREEPRDETLGDF